MNPDLGSLEGPLREVLEALNAHAADGAILTHGPGVEYEEDVEWWLEADLGGFGDVYPHVVAIEDVGILGGGVWHVYLEDQFPGGEILIRVVQLGGD